MYTQEKFENTALFLQLGLRSTLIRYGTFLKRSLNRRNLRFSVEENWNLLEHCLNESSHLICCCSDISKYARYASVRQSPWRWISCRKEKDIQRETKRRSRKNHPTLMGSKPKPAMCFGSCQLSQLTITRIPQIKDIAMVMVLPSYPLRTEVKASLELSCSSMSWLTGAFVFYNMISFPSIIHVANRLLWCFLTACCNGLSRLARAYCWCVF